MSSKTYESFLGFRAKTARQLSMMFSGPWPYVYLVLAILFQAGAWVFAAYIRSHLGGELLILHNNPYFGIDWIADGRAAFILPYWSLGTLALNFLSALLLARHRFGRLFVHSLLGLSVFVAALSLLDLLFIYFINFR